MCAVYNAAVLTVFTALIRAVNTMDAEKARSLRGNVVYIDLTDRPLADLEKGEPLACKVIHNRTVARMLFSTRLFADKSARRYAAQFCVLYEGCQSGVQFAFLYETAAAANESFEDAIERCSSTAPAQRFTGTRDLWGRLDVAFCNLRHDPTTTRPAVKPEHWFDHKTGVLDYEFEVDSAHFYVGLGEDVPLHLGAAGWNSIQHSRFAAFTPHKGLHPCDTAGVFYHTLASMAHRPKLKRNRIDETRGVRGLDTPLVTIFEIDKTEPPSCRDRMIETGFVDQPLCLDAHSNTFVQHGSEWRSKAYVKDSSDWEEDGWTRTLQTGKRGGSLITNETWKHPKYLEELSLNDMRKARLIFERENDFFAKHHYEVVSYLGRDARFVYMGKCEGKDNGNEYTREQVRAFIKSREDRDFAVAGFECAHVHDGGAMREEWRHATFEADAVFARDEVHEAMDRMRKRGRQTLSKRLGAPRGIHH